MIEITCEQGTTEWFDARKGACTASRFRDAISVYKRREGIRQVGEMTDTAIAYARLLACERIVGLSLDTTFVTPYMRRGTRVEDEARTLYEMETGKVVLAAGIYLTDDRRFGYSTDGVVLGQKGGIEIKSPGATDKIVGVWDSSADDILLEYRDQIQGGMAIAGWDYIDWCVYTPWLSSADRALFIQRIPRDDEYIDDVLWPGLLKFYMRSMQIEERLRDVRVRDPKIFSTN